jgi:peptidylamidoglycolate lyase
MKTSDFIFPRRLTRRDFLKMAGAASAALALPGCATEEKASGVRIGSGYHTYELVEDWGKLPEGMTYGYGCAVVVDGKDRVFVTSRAASHTVSIFDRHGKLLETWGDDFAAKVGFTKAQVAKTAHGLYWSKEGGQEFLYWTENVNSMKKPNYGGRVYKTDMQGKVLYTVGNVVKEDSTSQKFDWTNPTDVAVSPSGDVYVVDGYGSQRVSRFDKNFTHLKTIGGPGKEHGQFSTCHGVWINTLQAEPEVYIADRANGRIEVYSLALDYRRTVLAGEVRNPCCFYQHKDKIYIPDLASRVTVMDAHDKLVANLGDGKDQKDNETNPAMFAKPHALTVDSHGDLYVIEWIASGRPRKFRHVPQREV